MSGISWDINMIGGLLCGIGTGSFFFFISMYRNQLIMIKEIRSISEELRGMKCDE